MYKGGEKKGGKKFDKYPLKTQKHADYRGLRPSRGSPQGRGPRLLFKEVVMMMKRKEHLTAEGLHKIINIRWGPPQRSWDPILAGGLELL
jgi:hypothetical protein